MHARSGNAPARLRRLAAALTTLVAAVLISLVVPTGTAAADGCTAQGPDGSIIYTCTQGGGDGNGGSDGGGSGGGGGGPTCTLSGAATFCDGVNACWYLDSVVPFAPPPGEPPDGDKSNWKVRSCRFPDGGVETAAVWMGGQPQPPSLQEQAQTAFGQLDPALGELSTNPRTTSLVTLPTWFWASGLDDRLTGSSAFGLVAIAEPDHLEVDPGDGSGTRQCPWVTERSDACSHVYTTASSVSGTAQVDGHQAYALTAQPVWTVSFEMNGNPVNIPGAPTELRGPTMRGAERVAEVQAVVEHVD